METEMGEISWFTTVYWTFTTITTVGYGDFSPVCTPEPVVSPYLLSIVITPSVVPLLWQAPVGHLLNFCLESHAPPSSWLCAASRDPSPDHPAKPLLYDRVHRVWGGLLRERSRPDTGDTVYRG